MKTSNLSLLNFQSVHFGCYQLITWAIMPPTDRFLSLSLFSINIMTQPHTPYQPRSFIHIYRSSCTCRDKRMSLQVWRSSRYERMDAEDCEEMKHRRTQFLIYKVLKKADAQTRKRSSRICPVRVKVGMKKSRKRVVLLMKRAKGCLYRHIMKQIRNLEAIVWPCGNIIPAWNRTNKVKAVNIVKRSTTPKTLCEKEQYVLVHRNP